MMPKIDALTDEAGRAHWSIGQTTDGLEQAACGEQFKPVDVVCFTWCFRCGSMDSGRADMIARCWTVL